MNDSVDADVSDTRDADADATETVREHTDAVGHSADATPVDDSTRTASSETAVTTKESATSDAATEVRAVADQTSVDADATASVADGVTSVADDATPAADAATTDVDNATSVADDATSDPDDAPSNSVDATTDAEYANPDADDANPATHDATPVANDAVANNTVAEFTPEHLEDAEFRSALEAMLLVVDAPAPVEQLAAALDDTTERVDEVLREMRAELSARGSGIDLRFVGDGWRFYTRSEYAPYVERVLLDGARTKLTRAALETLAVVAYRQPVTRTRVSAVRGVNVDGVMRTLLARGLLAEAGVDPETNGTMYCTTELFLERIGLASLTDLPPLAPLLPGVDLIDEINESLDTDPRYTRLKKPAEADLDLGSED